MKRRTWKRRAVDFAFMAPTIFLLLEFGHAGWWTLVIVPYGLWNYWDGITAGEW